MDDSILRAIDAHVQFSTDKSAKVDLFRGAQLMVGLNCFERGQSQHIHSHAGADKFYVLMSGSAKMVVGETTVVARAGDVIWAPADIPHGVEEALERTVMLVGIAPPPRR